MTLHSVYSKMKLASPPFVVSLSEYNERPFLHSIEAEKLRSKRFDWTTTLS